MSPKNDRSPFDVRTREDGDSPQVVAHGHPELHDDGTSLEDSASRDEAILTRLGYRQGIVAYA